MTTDIQQAALEKPHVAVVYFARFDFLSGTQYLCSWNQTITWGGHDWLGFGAFGSVSPVEESDGLESKALNFTLNAADVTWISLAMGNVEEYRGRDATLYMCPLDEQYRLIDTPELCWTGVMSQLPASIDRKGRGQIVLQCETAAGGMKRRASLRMNGAQQKKKHPTDTGFDYLPDLIANPQVWLSKRFQQV